jgi:hypothetical protein
MRKYSMIILPIVISSIIILFIRCSEDPFTIPDINTSLPVITSIEASESRILIETSVQVSVTAQQGESYSWSAADGSFDAPTSTTTNWTASSTGGVYKLTCTVTNSSGSRKASINMQVLETLLPDGVTAYWSFDTGFNEEVGEIEGVGGVGVSITTDAAVGEGAALFEGADEEIESALFYPEADAPMGPEDLFTIMLWAKTEDEGLGFLFGRSFDGEYVEGGKGIYLEGGFVVFDIAWVDGFTAEEVQVNDGEWHHIVVVKAEEEFLFYVDGEEILAVAPGEWSDDEGTVVTIGAAMEEEGSDWPGTFQGTMDDVRFYPDALSEEDIIAIFEGG